MDKETITSLLLEQNKPQQALEQTVPREITGQVKRTAEQNISIISGIRRSGKSTLLRQLQRQEQRPQLYVNFDDDRFIEFTVQDFQKLLEASIETIGEPDVFFFDEIQNIKGWERFVRRLHDNGKTIYVTGSNATMLSKELGTHLTGRHITTPLYPFSFKEFLTFKNKRFDNDKPTPTERANLKKLFNEYAKTGGIPKYVRYAEEEYLRTLYKDILYRDIITRFNVNNEKALKETVYHCMSNVGKEVSYNSLKKLTGLSSATTIKEYLEYVESTYLLFQLNRFNHSLKKQIYANKKIYAVDQAISRIIGFRPTDDMGRILENIVFIQLKRENKEIYFHKQKQECDFLIREGYRITQAIQVCHRLDENNRKRETQGLAEAMGTHKLKEGILLTYDDNEKTITEQKKTIHVMPVWKWLLKQ